MNTEAVWTFLSTQGADFGLKVLGAIAAWLVGRWLIGFALRFVRVGLERGRRVDPTLSHYLVSILSVLLNIVLILAILDMFGVKTTSFAALLAGAGLAIGTAWGGLLTHFAAGVFLQVLRPYKVGDYVTIGGVNGTVQELGLFGTTLITPDNVTATVGNNKVLSDTIQNFSTLAFRRVDTTAKVANGVDVNQAIELLRQAVQAIPNVATQPPPDVEILQFTPEGPLLAVRPYTHTDHYWQVYFDTHKAIVKTFGAAGYPTPETPVLHRTAPDTAPKPA
ncbi:MULTISPECIES: mechanosensitive ion channel family protein [unclassified Variovorax]|jgi:small conductance mechanosensitive channel|uniref:mechanosensitive ion channel family protein n=1 Tax=unclassified Variovorax TaxID=663243 RepID=UPI0008F03F8C|nr:MULTISPECIES: mechanosensitive ion channel family protein [unclassified Variovorax]TAJ62805.1 MAG: mechanosensitive ion channel family protein [Variovorax sp.]SFP61798.1 small conductance mechanosensitive channel [Variovorax sp. PDC80]